MRWWQSMLARLGVRTPAARDQVLSGVLVVAVVTRAAFAAGSVPLGTLVAGHLIALADVAMVGVRRRWPRAVLAVATVLPLLAAALPSRPPWIGIGVVAGSYTVARYLARREAFTAIAVCWLAHTAAGLAANAIGGELDGLLTFWGTDPRDWVQLATAPAFVYLLPGMLGSYRRLRADYTTELARAAAVEERARIARELHDIAAHDLSAIVVQAGAADRLLVRDPEAARATLQAIRAQGRETLSSLRALVGIMRDDGDDRSPQPSLSRLDDLVTRARTIGMVVDLTAEALPALPPAADLAGYRVVQEALTNARRHASGAPVSVAVTVDDMTLRITVVNPCAAGAAARPGHGLRGMRERVRTAGGTLTAGPDGDGGWLVAAVIPLEPAERP